MKVKFKKWYTKKFSKLPKIIVIFAKSLYAERLIINKQMYCIDLIKCTNYD